MVGRFAPGHGIPEQPTVQYHTSAGTLQRVRQHGVESTHPAVEIKAVELRHAAMHRDRQVMHAHCPRHLRS